MLRQRLLVTLVLLPLGMAAIFLGGWYFTALMAVFLGLAAWEYAQLFRVGGLQPANVLVVGGVLLLLLGRMLDGFDSAPWILSLLILLSMAWHLVAYERGRDQSGTDLAVTLGGILYLGWIGGYFISLRSLPDGQWWVLMVLPAVWFADSGAYFIGRAWGRHKLSPRLSPKKTWEGYLGGIVSGVILTALFAAIWRLGAGPRVRHHTAARGADGAGNGHLPHPGRPGRVDDQAAGGDEELEQPAAGSRRLLRPGQLVAVGGSVGLLLDHLVVVVILFKRPG